MHVSLTPELEQLVRERVESGLYDNPSEVVREALRLLMEHRELHRLKMDRLRRALEMGESDIASGRFVAIENDDDLHEFFRNL